jgi:hypothetical protein
MARSSRLLLGLCLLGGCASRGALSPGAAAVTLSEEAPPAGLIEVGRVHAQSGKGCGMTGESGSREGAEEALRNQAFGLQASFVQITGSHSPQPNHQCLEHEYTLDGIAYREPAKSASPSTTTAAPPPPPRPAFPLLLNDYEGTAALGRPAAATERSSVVLALVAGETSPSALSVTFSCTGEDQRASLDVWNEARFTDWHDAGALSFSIKPDAELSLSVSFMDGHGTGYTSKTEQLSPGAWQVVTLPLNKFWHNPFGPPGDHPGTPVDTSRVTAFGFAPEGCQSGHFIIDDFKLVP